MLCCEERSGRYGFLGRPRMWGSICVLVEAGRREPSNACRAQRKQSLIHHPLKEVLRDSNRCRQHMPLFTSSNSYCSVIPHPSHMLACLGASVLWENPTVIHCSSNHAYTQCTSLSLRREGRTQGLCRIELLNADSVGSVWLYGNPIWQVVVGL